MIKFLFLLLILSSSFSAFACPIKNHIFLIHGIGGSVRTFGSMEKYLNKIDSCYVTTTFNYDTGNSTLSTYDFAQSFHQFVTAKVKSGAIAAHDKISLIMHSQGGVIGNIWLHNIGQTDKVLFSQVDAFITLSTPHWGADIANLGKVVFFTLPEEMDNTISPFGRIELNEMSYGSATIRDLIGNYEQLFHQNQIRPLALAGQNEGPSQMYESDVVVPIYSSRSDHFAGASDLSLRVTTDTIDESAFAKTKKVPLVVVPAVHINMGTIPGIASIPSNCLEDDGCNHPAIAAITDHLKGMPIVTVIPLLKKFRISFYFHDQSQQKIQNQDIELRLVKSKNVRIATLPNDYRGPSKLAQGTAFTLEGTTTNVGAQKVIFNVKIKNKISRQITVPVEGGFTSFLNVNVID